MYQDYKVLNLLLLLFFFANIIYIKKESKYDGGNFENIKKCFRSLEWREMQFKSL